MRRLRQMQSRGAGRGGGGPPQVPRGAGGALIGGVLLAGGAWVLSNSLFNVDGGHRAIKYRRISGVSKEIYSEGTELFGLQDGLLELVSALPRSMILSLYPRIKKHEANDTFEHRNPHQHSLVRNSHHLRCSSEAAQCCLVDGHKGFADGQHHLPCPIETSGRRPAPDLQNSGTRLRRASVAIDRERGAEERCRPVQRQPADHAARDGC